MRWLLLRGPVGADVGEGRVDTLSEADENAALLLQADQASLSTLGLDASLVDWDIAVVGQGVTFGDCASREERAGGGAV